MNNLQYKLQKKQLRKKRVRSTVHGSAQRPRLSVSISNIHISAQLIDDDKHATVASATTHGNRKLSGTMTDKAAVVGAEIADKAKKAKVTKVAFDRNGRKYHGRVKALAEAARHGGLEF